jgi:predicted nicotinamide N-methyase
VNTGHDPRPVRDPRQGDGRPAAIPDFETLLDRYAPLSPAPLCPDIRAFTARSLVEIWEAVERHAGCTQQAPFWAFPWPAGAALARTVLDHPALVRGKRVVDVGCGGGIASLACAKAGARVVANDTDPMALEVTRLAAARQGLEVETLWADLTREEALTEPVDVWLCGDLAYDRSAAPLERSLLRKAAERGATVLVADAERTYFDASGLELLGEYTLPVMADLEGVAERTARVYRVPGGSRASRPG